MLTGSVLSLLHSLSGPHRRPGSMNLANCCALSNSSANTMFGPAPTTCGGKRCWEHGGGQVGGTLGLELSNVSQISQVLWKEQLDTCSGLLLPVVLPPCLQPLPCSRRFWSSSDGKWGSRWGPWQWNRTRGQGNVNAGKHDWFRTVLYYSNVGSTCRTTLSSSC